MSEPNERGFYNIDMTDYVHQKNKPDAKTIAKHIVLFLLTFASVAFMGGIFFVGFTGIAESVWELVFWEGFLFAFLLLLFLGTHEFGHYFAAVHHKVEASLPFFIPLPFLSPIGTVGAVIKIKERITDSIKLYDIGISGPLAGFVVSLCILLYGFATLPGPDFLNNFGGHEDLVEYVQSNGQYPENVMAPEGSEIIIFGETLLYSFIASFFDNVPPMWEMYHYPFLLAGWLGLFFTALNLMPVGQLDGGHILYALIGYKKHRLVARVFFVILMTLGGLAAIPLLALLTDGLLPDGYSISWFLWSVLAYFLFRKAFYGHPYWTLGAWVISIVTTSLTLLTTDLNLQSGYGVWLFFAMLILFFVKIEHPPVYFERDIGKTRRILGWLTMIIFVLCISPTPFSILM